MFVKTKYDRCSYIIPNKPYKVHTNMYGQDYVDSGKGHMVSVVLDRPSLLLHGLGYFEPVITGLPKENNHEQ